MTYQALIFPNDRTAIPERELTLPGDLPQRGDLVTIAGIAHTVLRRVAGVGGGGDFVHLSVEAPGALRATLSDHDRVEDLCQRIEAFTSLRRSQRRHDALLEAMDGYFFAGHSEEESMRLALEDQAAGRL